MSAEREAGQASTQGFSSWLLLPVTRGSLANEMGDWERACVANGCPGVLSLSWGRPDPRGGAQEYPGADTEGGQGWTSTC